MTPSHPSSRPGGIPTPALTPLLGRDNELAELGRLLVRDDVRLVALTGGPGVGKTRLAARVVDVAQQDFDHVAWVSLEALRDSELVSSAIARTLGLDVGKGDIDVRLRDRLTQDRWLVALDNFEQVLTAAPLLTDLLTASPELTIVVTSRARLNVRGEHEFVVPPLALPGAAQLDNADALRSTPAVNLFLERARAAQPGLELTHEAARAVAEICIRLDGIPLGIELAAARLRMLTPQGILAELEESLDVLGQGPRDLPSRQQTWRRALEWRYELLDEDARCLLMRLAVFVGGWTTGAAMAVTDGDRPAGNVLDTIAALVDSSLVQPLATPDGEPRFRMLDTVRQFAMEQLVVEG